MQKAAELNLKGKWLKDKEVLKQDEELAFLLAGEQAHIFKILFN